MKLYSVRLFEGDRRLAWAGTQADAKQAMREQQAKHPGESIVWVEDEVPVDKYGLLAWLNANAVYNKEDTAGE